ncbi:cell division protein FtsZ [Lacibacter sediminis]|uniref:Cell division protein FtsZ n=1 Tax=Lacibacter sediminis TaxID=2760713 RepID=A0A7G5XE23_9BACT|nr:cell division protein FtsZ [Lacibacter sediminis]QNA43726.1 cell division protein FtsZ [Lacibacter sediminis]
MIHFDLPKEKSSIIKVIGVGGGGSNAVNHMHAQVIEGVNFIICNTDAQAIAQSMVPNKVQLGPHLTQGLGAGANPEIGRQATEESLEELKTMLEVNTKMAFITAGMGGGTGTGGAPIIAKICKDLGILTVGIVTTPFGYEGKKRIQQAEDGIGRLKEYVDTLLVISNDKLRHQFGNLKMKEAFSKADNVLATAAKCITDVINSTGQINVDFADVCTVMKNGGVAILGNASANGDNRAQRAIEEALNSPLLNDNDIKGAKWILININSAEGDHEFTMDEVEIIQNHLLSQAGENTDVILGLGYDSTLGDKIGITLIATGFEAKDPFDKKPAVVEEVKPKTEKIVMTLAEPEKKAYSQPALFAEEPKPTPAPAPAPAPVENVAPAVTNEVNLQPVLSTEVPVAKVEVAAAPVVETEKIEFVLEPIAPVQTMQPEITAPLAEVKEEVVMKQPVQEVKPTSAFLKKPTMIYVETDEEESIPEIKAEEKPVEAPVQQLHIVKDEEESFDMQLVEKKEQPTAEKESRADQNVHLASSEEPPVTDEAEEQRKKAADRLQKLRNLSFNIHGSDPNNEFDTVPAYLRRNLELYNTISPAENFYSNYTVQSDENNQAQINTINTFLDGKKPD